MLNVKELIYKNCCDVSNLNQMQQKQLIRLLTDNESLFDGTLGWWTGELHKMQLKDNVQPYHAKPFPVPHAYKATLKTEVERLEKIGVMKKVNRSKWAAPLFIIPEKGQDSSIHQRLSKIEQTNQKDAISDV